MLQLCGQNENIIPCGHYSISRKKGKGLRRVSIPPKTLFNNSLVYDSSTDWIFLVIWNFCLQHPTQPIQQFMFYCLSEKKHTPPQALHIKKKNLLLPQTKKMAAFQDSIVHKHSGQELLEH